MASACFRALFLRGARQQRWTQVGRVGETLHSRVAFTDCKRWRLAADALNDVAFFLDILCAYAPKHIYALLICTSSLLRSVVGVAGE